MATNTTVQLTLTVERYNVRYVMAFLAALQAFDEDVEEDSAASSMTIRQHGRTMEA